MSMLSMLLFPSVFCRYLSVGLTVVEGPSFFPARTLRTRFRSKHTSNVSKNKPVKIRIFCPLITSQDNCSFCSFLGLEPYSVILTVHFFSARYNLLCKSCGSLPCVALHAKSFYSVDERQSVV
jgi:hypothetical protein